MHTGLSGAPRVTVIDMLAGHGGGLPPIRPAL